MSFEPPQPPRPEAPPRRQPPSGPSGLVLLAVMAALVLGGYFLAVKLREMGRIQDCAMSGRTNCAPVETTR